MQKKCKLRLNQGETGSIPYLPSNLQPHVNWYANKVYTILAFDFRMAKRFDWLNKTKAVKAVKASKLTQSETSETFREFQCREMYFFVQKSVSRCKKFFKTGRIAAHEFLDVKKHHNLKANCSFRKVNPKVSLFNNSIKFADVFPEVML